MKRLAILIFALGLGGCAITAEQNRPSPSVPPPAVTVEGPHFAATAFACGLEPAPPAPGDDKREGSSAAHYETALAAWGRGCRLKLNSAGRRLDAAGLVER